MAASSIANIVKSSLGPVGLDKEKSRWLMSLQHVEIVSKGQSIDGFGQTVYGPYYYSFPSLDFRFVPR